LLKETRQILIRKGVDQLAKPQIEAFLEQLDTKVDPKTGKTVPRDWSKLTPTELHDLLTYEKGTYGILSKYSKFESTRPEAVNNLARRIREAAIKRLDEQVPGIAARMSSEHDLVVNREAAIKLRTDAINGKITAGRGLLYSAGGLALYGGLHALGLGVMAVPFIGTMVLMKALYAVSPRTLAASLLYRAGELWDTAVKQAAEPQVAGPQAQGPPALQAPALQAPAAPKAQLSLGSGPQAAPAPAAPTATPPAAPVETNTPTVTTKPQELQERVPQEKSNVAKTNTEPEQMKLFLDRLDELQNRLEKPKSGADRVAIQREIAALKKLISGEATGKEASKIKKNIADRERIQKQRIESAVKQSASTGKTVSESGEPVAQGMTPEDRTILLEKGYEKLATYEGGKEWVVELKKLSKDMQKVDPTWDEVQKLHEALELAKGLKEQ
jgi:hypothetical protein